MEHVAALSTHVIPPHELIPREHRARCTFSHLTQLARSSFCRCPLVDDSRRPIKSSQTSSLSVSPPSPCVSLSLIGALHDSL